jgi:hypothetical protein
MSLLSADANDKIVTTPTQRSNHVTHKHAGGARFSSAA